MVDRRIQQQLPKSFDDMSQGELLAEVKKLAARGASGQQGDYKEEDALALLRQRPKIEVTTYHPRTDRSETRTQDRKVWESGVIEPLVYEDNPEHAQIVRVVSIPDGEVLFERESVLVATPTARRQVGGGSSGPDLQAILDRLDKLEKENTELRSKNASEVEDLTGAGKTRGGSRAQ